MRAIVLREDKQVAIEQCNVTDLPDGDVLVNVAYSTLNYKDALALTASAPIAKSYPMVPGIDFVGVVEKSDSAEFAVGDTVVLNGWGVGEKHWARDSREVLSTPSLVERMYLRGTRIQRSVER